MIGRDLRRAGRAELKRWQIRKATAPVESIDNVSIVYTLSYLFGTYERL